MNVYSIVQTQTPAKPTTIRVMNGLLQRAVINNSQTQEVPPIVHDVLHSSGQPLDAETRAFMEQRFGHDFSGVRVQTDARAVESAREVQALAYTVGHKIVFGAGRYAPERMEGQQLIAHELAHVVQQAAISQIPGGLPLNVAPANSALEHEAENASAAVATNHSRSFQPSLRTARPYVQRVPVPTSSVGTAAPAAGGTASLDEFRGIMRVRYGVSEIRVGTFEEQVNRLSGRGGNPPTGLSRNTWQPFDPSASPEIFTRIIEAFRDFEQSIGGIPATDRILFFDMHYDFDPALGGVIPNPDLGASFGAGELMVYRASTTRRKGLPIARSNPQGRYRGTPTAVLVGPGSTPGAPVPLPSQAESTNLIIVHELGHGLTEAAHRADSNVFDDYNRAVGWLGISPALYDIGASPVQQAIRLGTVPPPAFEITDAHWNNPRWAEQPLSRYMISGGPGEDFAEAVMTYVRNRELLRSRSPHRYEFIHARIERWLPQLRRRPPVGDFPSLSKTYV